MEGVRSRDVGTSTLDLALKIVDHLVGQSRPLALGEIAGTFSASKATVYRHLVTLQRHGFVRQDVESGRYAPGIKLMVLGEALRNRFDIVANARPALMGLRDRTGQAVTLCKLIDLELVVLELVQGRAIIEFATRPGTRMALHASAHGRIWLAFGPERLLEETLSRPLPPWTPQTLTAPHGLRTEVARVKKRGWASAPNQVLTGVNTLAAPVFDHCGTLSASIAIVGSTQFIAASPSADQIAEVVACARDLSRDLGWKA